jgi:hypothetical protein
VKHKWEIPDNNAMLQRKTLWQTLPCLNKKELINFIWLRAVNGNLGQLKSPQSGKKADVQG